MSLHIIILGRFYTFKSQFYKQRRQRNNFNRDKVSRIQSIPLNQNKVQNNSGGRLIFRYLESGHQKIQLEGNKIYQGVNPKTHAEILLLCKHRLVILSAIRIIIKASKSKLFFKCKYLNTQFIFFSPRKSF
jgi:hypothetical protein